MSRIRTVKPDLLKHDELYEAERETGLPLRIAFVGLFTVCDREGRFTWKPRRLKIDVLPYDELDFSHVLFELNTRGFIVHYENSGVEYGCVSSFTTHQVINNKESESKIPAPDDSESTIIDPKTSPVLPEALLDTETRSDMFTPDDRDTDATMTRTGKDQGERKGKEGKGKEGVASNDACPAEAEPKPRNDQSEKILEVFKHWQIQLNHPQAKLDDKRKGYIRKALKSGYTIDQLKQAIDGCGQTPHNMGQNDRNQVYDGIHLIFRDADQIDRFIRNAGQPAVQQMNQAGRATQAAAKAVMDEMFGGDRDGL